MLPSATGTYIDLLPPTPRVPRHPWIPVTSYASSHAGMGLFRDHRKIADFVDRNCLMCVVVLHPCVSKCPALAPLSV